MGLTSLCSLPAVPPTLRGVAKPELKKRRRLRLPHGAKRQAGPRVRVRPPPSQPPPHGPPPIPSLFWGGSHPILFPLQPRRAANPLQSFKFSRHRAKRRAAPPS